jgi:hypothetical protein
LTPFGVYSDDWSVVPISVLQNARFSDLYGENPAYLSIMNLFIDNTLDLSVSGITSKLKYETFAVSGTVPILQSIVTTESLIVKPEIPIQLTLNDVGVSMSTQMERELPVLVTLADLDTYGEYVVIISPTPSVLDVSVAASSVLPQKFASAQNLIALYNIQLKDVAILDVAGNVFGDDLPQNAYEGIIGSFANSTFEASYLNYPLSFQEYVKILPVTTTEMNNLSVNREIIVRSEGNGFRYTIYDDGLLSDYASTPISALADFTFDTNLGTTTYDVTIKATTSPYTSGQSARRNPTDIFRDEIRIEIESASDGYGLPYGDLPVSSLSGYAISDTLYDRPLSLETFGTTYPSLYTASDYTTYAKIAGTVSSANAGFETLPISAYSEIAIDVVDESLLSDLVPIVIGATTGLTQPSQNLSGTNSNTGFFFYGWGDEPSSDDLTFSSIQVGWTVVGQPTWVVTAVGDGSTNYNVTISGGEFASGGTYRFTGMIIGGTNFVSDFSFGDVFVANNEYFTVESVANTTYMITDRLPANAFSGVVAYKIPTPTYTFSSIPTSINEGANGTFNVTTTDVANGTALYWTINNVTTGSGDFV